MRGKFEPNRPTIGSSHAYTKYEGDRDSYYWHDFQVNTLAAYHSIADKSDEAALDIAVSTAVYDAIAELFAIKASEIPTPPPSVPDIDPTDYSASVEGEGGSGGGSGGGDSGGSSGQSNPITVNSDPLMDTDFLYDGEIIDLPPYTVRPPIDRPGTFLNVFGMSDRADFMAKAAILEGGVFITQETLDRLNAFKKQQKCEGLKKAYSDAGLNLSNAQQEIDSMQGYYDRLRNSFSGNDHLSVDSLMGYGLAVLGLTSYGDIPQAVRSGFDLTSFSVSGANQDWWGMALAGGQMFLDAFQLNAPELLAGTALRAGSRTLGAIALLGIAIDVGAVYLPNHFSEAQQSRILSDISNDISSLKSDFNTLIESTSDIMSTINSEYNDSGCNDVTGPIR